MSCLTKYIGHELPDAFIGDQLSVGDQFSGVELTSCSYSEWCCLSARQLGISHLLFGGCQGSCSPFLTFRISVAFPELVLKLLLSFVQVDVDAERNT